MAFRVNTWMKYTGIAMAFAGVASRVFAWLQFAEAAGGVGGEKITPQEIVQLQPIIQDAINQGLMSAGVPVMVTVVLTYTGE